ncbi:MAG: DUF3575 domain-containing protein [Chitinophagaceae bacterium]|nr:DUF3575 domain-containing protein [Chitinophagaceae bacterium]
MKRTIILGAAALLLSTSLFAQNDDKKSGGEMPEKKNAVKLNLTSLVYKNIGIQYERALTPKIAVACQLRLMPKGSLPFSGSLDAAAGDSIDISAVKVGSFAITPEFRFYPKHVMKGFYLAPYIRYRNVSLEAPIKYTADNNTTQTLTLDGKFSTFGGGLMIGSHFNIGKSFSLDWFILGAHFSSTKMTLSGKATGVNLSASEQADLRNELNSALSDNKLIKNATVAVNSQGADLSGKFSLVGLRGFGLNFGYRF